jgi:single-strand DNA-binding protein
MNTNEIPAVLAGHRVRDPELRWTADGKAVASISVAVTPRRYDQASKQWVDGTPTYADCSVWGEQGEHVADSLRKGDRVLVLGRWTTRTYTVGGEERRKLEVVVNEVGPSLRWATALPTKTTGKPGLQAVPESDEPPF